MHVPNEQKSNVLEIAPRGNPSRLKSIMIKTAGIFTMAVVLTGTVVTATWVNFTPTTLVHAEKVDCQFGMGCGCCFSGDTLVTMADGTTKRLDEVRVGDRVLSFHESSQVFISARVGEVISHGPQQVRSLNGVHVTNEHPVLTMSGWKLVGNLKGDDVLLSYTGKHDVVLSDGTVATTPVYNLSVDGPHTYLVGPKGLIAHNKGGDD